MYVIREILHCKPGQVRPMVQKFRAISEALTAIGRPPLRLLTDVSGGPFWTVIAEATVETVDGFFAVEQQLTADPKLRDAMAGYHDLVSAGRREIYRIESEAAGGSRP